MNIEVRGQASAFWLSLGAAFVSEHGRVHEIQQVRELAAAKWAEGEAKGRVDGKAEAVLAVLDARGIGVGEEVRAPMKTCTDLSVLNQWIVRAITAASVEEVIAGLE